MSESSKVEFENFSNESLKDFNETEINELTRRSLKEGLCGVLNCYNKPTSWCQMCTNYYYQEHMEPHLDIVPDGELDYVEIGKKGLDYYT